MYIVYKRSVRTGTPVELWGPFLTLSGVKTQISLNRSMHPRDRFEWAGINHVPKGIRKAIGGN